MKLYIIALMSLMLTGCKEDPPPLISPHDYEKNTELCLNIANKLTLEENAEKLFTIADSLQKGRVGYCKGVAEECNTYADFIELAIHLSRDKELTGRERRALKEQLGLLKIKIREGRQELKKLYRE